MTFGLLCIQQTPRPTRSIMALFLFLLSVSMLQAAIEKHTRAECFLIYNVLYDGVVECSNSLEDEDEVELPPQAVLYLPVRERIYGLLLPVQPGAFYLCIYLVFMENVMVYVAFLLC